MDLTITDTVVHGLPDSYSAPPLLVASRFALAYRRRAEGWTRAEKAVNGAATYANDTVTLRGGAGGGPRGIEVSVLDFSDPREQGRALGSAAISVPDEVMERGGGGQSGSVWVTSPLTATTNEGHESVVKPAKGATFSQGPTPPSGRDEEEETK